MKLATRYIDEGKSVVVGRFVMLGILCTCITELLKR